MRSLNFRALTLLILAGVLALTAIMFVTTPRELAPEEDQGVIFALIKAPQYGNLDYIERSTAQLSKFSAELPEFDHLFAINGYQGVTSGFGGIILKNWGDRTRSQKDVLQAISPKFDQITGAKVIGFAPPALPGSTGGPPVQFVLRSIGDYKDIAATMAKIETAAQKSGLFIFSDSDLKFDTPQLEIKIDQRQGQPPRPLDAGDRLLARDLPRRQLRQPLQPLWPLLRGDPAGAARQSFGAGLAPALPAAHGDRRSRAAVGRRQRPHRRCSRTACRASSSSTRRLCRASPSPATPSARRSSSCRSRPSR